VYVGIFSDANCTQAISSWIQHDECYSPKSESFSILTQCFGDFGAPESLDWTWRVITHDTRQCKPDANKVTSTGENGDCVFTGEVYVQVNCTDQGTSSPTSSPTPAPTTSSPTSAPSPAPTIKQVTTVDPVTMSTTDVDSGFTRGTTLDPLDTTEQPRTTDEITTTEADTTPSPELSSYTVTIETYASSSSCTGASISSQQTPLVSATCTAIPSEEGTLFLSIKCFNDGTYMGSGFTDLSCSTSEDQTYDGASGACTPTGVSTSVKITCVPAIRRRRNADGTTESPTTTDGITEAATATEAATTAEVGTTTEAATTTSAPSGSPTPFPSPYPTIKPDDFYLTGHFGEVLNVRGEHYIGKSVTLEVVTTDDGGLKFTKNINVMFVEDANTPPARLVQRVFDVQENSPYGTIIGDVKALDFDIPAQDVTYELADSTLSSRFSIDMTTGNLTVAANNVACLMNGGDDCLLNFEKQKHYIVNIRATDSGDPPKSNTFGVLVRLQNVNDKPRNIKLDSSEPSSSIAASIFDIARFGDRIGLLSCTDEEPSQTHRFEKVKDSDDRNLFDVNEHSGVVTLARNLTQADRTDLLSNGTMDYFHRLVVQCIDSGVPAMAQEGDFAIEVKDTEEVAYQTAKAYYIREIETATSVVNPNSILRQAKSVYKANNGFYWGPYFRGNTTDEVMKFLQQQVAAEKAKENYDSCKAIEGSSTAVRFQCYVDAYNKFGGEGSADQLAIEHEKIHGDAPVVDCLTCPYNMTFSFYVTDFASLVSPNDTALLAYLANELTHAFSFAEERMSGMEVWKQVVVNRRRAPTSEMDVTYVVSLPVNETNDNQPMQDIVQKHYHTILHQEVEPEFDSQKLTFVPHSFHATAIRPTAEASSSGSSAGMMPIIGGVAVLLIIIVIVIIVVMRKRRNSGREGGSTSKNSVVGSDRHVTSFVNPVYEENTTKLNPVYDESAQPGMPSYEEDFNDVDGLYDEMPGVVEGDDDYLDMPGFVDGDDAFPDDDAFNGGDDDILYDAPAEGDDTIYDNGNFEDGFDEENIYDNNEDFGDSNGAGDDLGSFEEADFGEVDFEDEGGYLDVKPDEF
jgi:hypothetical protein